MSHCGLCGRWIDDCKYCKHKERCNHVVCVEWSICEQCARLEVSVDEV